MDEEFELIEGKLQIKRDAGGWQHYLKDGEKDRDIHCGAYMEVKLIDDDLGGWLKGRYDAYLATPVEAYLIFGEFCPCRPQEIGIMAQVTIPLGTVIKVKKSRDQ